MGTDTCQASSVLCSPVTVASTQVGPGTAANGAFLSFPLSAATHVLRVDFDVNLAKSGGGGGQVQFASLELSGKRFVFLDVAGGMVRLGDQCPLKDPADYHAEVLVVAPVAAQWTRYQLYVDLRAGTATLGENNAPLASATRPLQPSVLAAPVTPVAFRLGATYTNGTAASIEDFDDVGVLERP